MTNAHKLERVRGLVRCFGLLVAGALACACDAGAVREGVAEPLTQDAASDALDAEAPTADAGPERETSAGLEAGADAAAEAASSEQAPELSAATWAALRALRYDSSAPPPDPSNAVADKPAARALGQRLFFDAALSGRLRSRDNDGSAPTLGKAGEAGRVSCASCHVPSSGFFDTRSHHQQISLASSWTRRRTPTLLEVGFLPLLNWDGAHDTLWSQAIGVMESAAEFNSGRLFVAQQMFRLHRAEYEALFGSMPALGDTARFPALSALEVGCGEAEDAACRGKPGDGADYDRMSAEAQEQATRVTVNAAKAMAAYLRGLRCGASRFDAWLDGASDKLSPGEQRGAALFVGRGDCVRCHSGPRLTDGAFHNVGLRPATVAVAFTDTGDRGAGEGLPHALANPLRSAGPFSDGSRGAVPTPGAAHEGAFRTPTLRCAERSPSFMHTGQLRTLEQVVMFFSQGGHPAPGYPGMNELKPLGLSETERADLTAFLRTLDGPGPASELLTAPR
jgi:cytochrome c peroxidase